MNLASHTVSSIDYYPSYITIDYIDGMVQIAVCSPGEDKTSSVRMHLDEFFHLGRKALNAIGELPCSKS